MIIEVSPWNGAWSTAAKQSSTRLEGAMFGDWPFAGSRFCPARNLWRMFDLKCTANGRTLKAKGQFPLENRSIVEKFAHPSRTQLFSSFEIRSSFIREALRGAHPPGMALRLSASEWPWG